jgi:hypothetical protein
VCVAPFPHCIFVTTCAGTAALCRSLSTPREWRSRLCCGGSGTQTVAYPRFNHTLYCSATAVTSRY